MKKKRPLDEESTAFHEAGHAVVGYLLGFYLDGISIFRRKDIRGVTLRRRQRQQAVQGVVDYDITQRPPDDDVPLTDLLTYLYAGVAAQRLLCTKRGVSSKRVRLGNGIYTARKKVRNLPKEEQIKLLSSAEKRAITFLSDPHNWQVLERIAARLLEVDTLDGPSLHVLLEDIQKT